MSAGRCPIRIPLPLLGKALVLITAMICGPAFAAHADIPIKIAAIFSKSGPAAIANAPSLEGVRWAVAEINAAGGVLGRTLDLIELDNLGTPIGAKVAADEAVAREVAAIIGPSWSSHSMAVAKVAQAHKIPMISNTSTHPGLTAIGDYIFRVCYNDLLQGRALAQFARNQLKGQSAVICVDMASDFGMGLSDSFQSVFERLGGRVLERIPYKPRQSNFRETTARIKTPRPRYPFCAGL
jgi:branched-chain amino acid transport system substrate-binding protein